MCAIEVRKLMCPIKSESVCSSTDDCIVQSLLNSISGLPLIRNISHVQLYSLQLDLLSVADSDPIRPWSCCWCCAPREGWPGRCHRSGRCVEAEGGRVQRCCWPSCSHCVRSLACCLRGGTLLVSPTSALLCWSCRPRNLWRLCRLYTRADAGMRYKSSYWNSSTKEDSWESLCTPARALSARAHTSLCNQGEDRSHSL